jgi:hypothetical protein
MSQRIGTGRSNYTNTISQQTAKALTSAYVTFGDEIDMRKHNKLGVNISANCNSSLDVDFKLVTITASGETTEFEIDSLSVKHLWVGSGSDSDIHYEFDVGTCLFILLKAKAGTVGVTAGTLTISINKKII